MVGRRTFLQRLGALAATVGLPAFAHSSVAERPTATANYADWAWVRQQFAVIETFAWLNCGSIGPSPHAVTQVVATKNAWQERYGKYMVLPPVRQQLADFFGTLPQQMALTANTTAGLNIVAQGLPLRRKDEVVVCSHEHGGHALPWLWRAQRDGIRLRVIAPAPTAAGNLQAVAQAMGPRTRAIALPHITCTTGLVYPIEGIVQLAAEKDVYVCIDGAQAAGIMPLQLNALGIHSYASSGHKWMLGPNGTGFLHVAPQLLAELPPLLPDASAATAWQLTATHQGIDGWRDSAQRFECGTINPALFEGMAEASRFLQQVGLEAVEARSKALTDYCYEQLQALAPRVTLLTPAEPQSRHCMVTFTIQGADALQFFQYAYNNKVRVRAVPEAGLNAIRVGWHMFNTTDEVDRLIALIKAYR